MRGSIHFEFKACIMKPNEKSKLLKRLKGFCGMMGDNLSSLDRDLVERLESTIERLEKSAKVVIAGISGSDHRRLAEFLVGADLFDADDETNYPTIQIRHGAKPRTHAIIKQERTTLDGVNISALLSGTKTEAIGIELPNSVAERTEFAILPDYDDEHDRVRYLVDLIENTDAIIWCSDAATPWQPSERRVWFTIPDELKSRSILAMTGADKVSGAEAQKANKEKRDVIVDEFSAISPINLDTAKQATRDGVIVDQAGFIESGAQEILTRVLALIEAEQGTVIAEARALRAEIDEIPIGDVAAMPPMPTVELPKDIDQSPRAAIQRILLGGLTKCQAAVEEDGANDFTAVFEAMNALLTDSLKGTQENLKDDPECELIAAQIAEASELVGLLSYENNKTAAQEAADILRQIVTEMWRRVESSEEDGSRNLTLYPQLSEAS